MFLSLPGDILKDEADLDLMAPTRVAPRVARRSDRRSKPPPTLLANAKRPVIIAGDAVAQSHAHAELVELAELIGAPVYTEFVPNTASFPTSHPLFRGSMTRLAPDVRKVLEQYDLLFSVGADLFTLSLPSDVDPMPPGMPLIHLDTDPWQIGKNYPAQVGDPRRSERHPARHHRGRARAHERPAPAAARTTASRPRPTPIAAERDALESSPRLAGSDSPVQPLALLDAIGEMLPKDAVVVEEALSSAPGIRSLIRSDDPQSYLRAARRRHRLGPAGGDRRQARAARPPGGRADRRRQRIYTVQALWTAARYKHRRRSG